MAFKLSNGHSNKRTARQPRFSEINVTPMVDVMLVLLVIFMVTAPMMTTGVTVDLPNTNASPVAGQDEPLAVTVGSDGKVYVQKSEVQVKDLSNKLRAITGEKKDTRIFVRGDRSVDYGRIMQVVGEINSAGFTKVALITEVKGESPARGR
jgi:biopolymer transport protein TolR